RQPTSGWPPRRRKHGPEYSARWCAPTVLRHRAVGADAWGAPAARRSSSIVPPGVARRPNPTPGGRATPAWRRKYDRCRRSWCESAASSWRSLAPWRLRDARTIRRNRCARHQASRRSMPLARFLDASLRNRISHRLLREVGRGFFQNIALRLDLDQFLAQPRHFELIRLHLTMTGERLLRVSGHVPDPLPQHVLMDIQIARRFPHRYASLLHQLYRLKLELATEHSSSHHTPPDASLHLNKVSGEPGTGQ